MSDVLVLWNLQFIFAIMLSTLHLKNEVGDNISPPSRTNIIVNCYSAATTLQLQALDRAKADVPDEPCYPTKNG